MRSSAPFLGAPTASKPWRIMRLGRMPRSPSVMRNKPSRSPRGSLKLYRISLDRMAAQSIRRAEQQRNPPKLRRFRYLSNGMFLFKSGLKLSALFIVVGVSLCVSVLAAGLWLSAPVHVAIGPPPNSLPSAEPVQISSASGSLLRGWWLPLPRRGAGAVVLMHGIRANRLSMVRRAERLHSQGYAVLLFDF